MGKEIEPSEIHTQQKQQPHDHVDHHDDHDRKHSLGDQEINDEKLLKFMDSLDSYLSLTHSLSSTLRQGWFDFASARHSMGASRVNSVLLDLKEHPAATHVQVGVDEEPHFILRKWVSANAEDSETTKDENSILKPMSVRQRHKENSEAIEAQEDSSSGNEPLDTVENRVQKDRKKSLAVFGTLVSPKLRSAQLSFETALETLVQVANARASMLSSFNQLQEHVDGDQN